MVRMVVVVGHDGGVHMVLDLPKVRMVVVGMVRMVDGGDDGDDVHMGLVLPMVRMVVVGMVPKVHMVLPKVRMEVCMVHKVDDVRVSFVHMGLRMDLCMGLPMGIDRMGRMVQGDRMVLGNICGNDLLVLFHDLLDFLLLLGVVLDLLFLGAVVLQCLDFLVYHSFK